MSAKFENNNLIVLNPLTREEEKIIPLSDKEDINKIILDSSLDDSWSLLSVNKRSSLISKFRKAIVKNKIEIQKTIKSETGKVDFDISIELFTSMEHLKRITGIAKKALRIQRRNSGLMKTKKAYVKYEPLGIAGIISPWNYPLATPLIASVEALLAGNNVVLKPSEHTPLTSLLLKKIWDDYIGYKNAFQIVIGAGSAGEHIVKDAKIDIVCFTGSTLVGKIIAKQCAETLKPCILELGGKDPMIILNDANINRAIESAIFGGLSNAGQTCISTEEIFVEDGLYEEFVAKISNRIKDVKSGEYADYGTMIVSETADKVNRHINEVKDSCKIIEGKTEDRNLFIPPTLVLEPDENSLMVNEETFGPVLSVRKFSNEEELIKKIHKTGYGLSSSIFGRNKRKIDNIVKKLKIGTVSINDVLTHYGIASIPFGGEGLSGIGRMHGKEGLRSFSRTKSIVVNRFNFISEIWWIGRSSKIESLLNKAISLLFK